MVRRALYAVRVRRRLAALPRRSASPPHHSLPAVTGGLLLGCDELGVEADARWSAPAFGCRVERLCERK